ncbi:MAG TPA: M48 family metalloprotease [Gordonia sp. (in: high G+C Gram-positive bacteria)]|uniref:M56 family metallopeptidase n=1 Tax=unclassified Gordonia (in: high G+C Gram-positive bacteria) TaxID=2657482 RepID=UPI0025BE302A|nr:MULTISPECIES: M56 family metallopeptidase [unclassified Gordonia (in: high G+C Gram-positive bacteria)]HNP56361.1 M48 family metalloprotease [Gordonia sp. (in: high G+C Gram-positive bacteria)]HRC50045.1 M48 family metalloprotease [Gordonia sp. (in: high G+C Gram-positive bacteria)]
MIAVAFGLLCLLLVGPVPDWLSRAQWPMRAPRAAMALWQAIALAAILSAFSAGLAIAANLLRPDGDAGATASIPVQIERLGWPLWLLSVAAFAATVLVGARLAFTTVGLAVRTRSRRAAHRRVVDLIATVDEPVVADYHPLRAQYVRRLAVDRPLAYCLPGRNRRVVVTDGTVARLSDDELRAVLAHERAHLRARHDLVLEAFIALQAAFPRFVRSKSALGSVELLAETLADDQAVRSTSPTTLARALVAVSDAGAPEGALAVGGSMTLARINRLAAPNSVRVAVAAYAAAAAVLVVPTLAVAIPWLRELSRLVSG